MRFSESGEGARVREEVPRGPVGPPGPLELAALVDTANPDRTLLPPRVARCRGRTGLASVRLRGGRNRGRSHCRFRKRGSE